MSDQVGTNTGDPYNEYLTEVGRALTKRQKPENNFPKVKGNNAQVNAIGAKTAKKIMKNPEMTFIYKKTRKTGNSVNFVDPDGLGVKTDEHGKFITFIDKSYDYVGK